ncbi:hypothetical protein HRG_009642 [Hirsutella rhossiliensis]|uniref:Uncharacterized protein n=1 Tax=Hirsutella rhossiliensis TaxID=111463 RepID=A0A9P8SFN0_9HYPO|nr:uncharacterized protein HRG_09642 [Hirsutella rhossiliensis]KAH0959181.1 hypothetical protein HRG_09642 [Hirsutella rhossiliensis]
MPSHTHSSVAERAFASGNTTTNTNTTTTTSLSVPLAPRKAGDHVLAPIGTGRPLASTCPKKSRAVTEPTSVEELVDKFAALDLLGPSRNRPAPRKSCLKKYQPTTPPNFYNTRNKASGNSNSSPNKRPSPSKRMSPRVPRPRSARKRAAFRAGRHIATCLETGTPIPPISPFGSSRSYFRARHTLRVLCMEKRRQSSNGFWNDEDPDYINHSYAEALAASGNLFIDDFNSPTTQQEGAGGGYPSEQVIDLRLQLATQRAEVLSVQAIKRGAIDFALYVCKFGSRRHAKATRHFQKYQNKVLLGSYKGPEKIHAIPGGPGYVALAPWFYDISTAMSAYRSVFYY